MIIKFDPSYISAGTRELIERGYAREELDKLVFGLSTQKRSESKTAKWLLNSLQRRGQPPRTGRLGGEAK